MIGFDAMNQKLILIALAVLLCMVLVACVSENTQTVLTDSEQSSVSDGADAPSEQPQDGSEAEGTAPEQSQEGSQTDSQTGDSTQGSTSASGEVNLPRVDF